MAGGTFNQGGDKVRPGVYINFESARQDSIDVGSRGVALIPLVGHSYGPAKKFITLESGAPDASIAKLGFSVYEDTPGMLLIREAFKNARTVIVYIPSQGAKATNTSGGLTATARYGGSRGNALTVGVTQNPVDGFDVTVYLGTVSVSEYPKLTTIESLIEKADPWIEFSGTGLLSPAAGLSLAGGADGALAVSDMTAFLDASEAIHWNTMAFPLEATGEPADPIPGLYQTLLAKIKYLREDAGKYRKAVVPNFAADYEGVINVTNAVALTDRELTPAEVTAWVAGADAGASHTQSMTYTKYAGATDIIGLKSHTDAVAAINNGEFFFSFSEAGEVVVEYDINSLTTFDPPKDATYRKNRVLRVFDTFAESLLRDFPPNKFANSPIGWDVMEGIGRAVLKRFLDDGAIKNVDYNYDFRVDRSVSAGDETYFNVGLEPIDSSEKLFFTIKTR